ncbi:hypothetical protein ATHL_03518 [Anaerolinea thermolimosa]|uniref:Carrier domain-containing protein n=1 Tax=Anaerolinea thermolimosa TaxID=229919 RepID=A0A7U9PUD1_9CHLR|nr:hypothetical protein [Anaerolinea thermolimosa]GAP08613.1 hypothetical protein ATHL_03518 [Anaerolinea thermolimosa]
MTYSSEVPIERAGIIELITTSAQDVLQMRDGAGEQLPVLGEETRLIGQGAILDSLGLVSLIVEVEQRLSDELGINLILADERAMSQKRSPFRSIGALADYICDLIAEQGAHA